MVNNMEFISKEEFKKNAENNMGVHWKNWEKRWVYFNKAIQFVNELQITNHRNVVEVGTMGASVVKNCDTIDYDKKWDFKGKNPTHNFDLREVPWKIDDKKYDLFIALRVFQHLCPVQKECFLEAKRIAKNVLIVVPEEYKGKGISLKDFTSWNNGTPPDKYENLYGSTNIYLWKFNG